MMFPEVFYLIKSPPLKTLIFIPISCISELTGPKILKKKYFRKTCCLMPLDFENIPGKTAQKG